MKSTPRATRWTPYLRSLASATSFARQLSRDWRTKSRALLTRKTTPRLSAMCKAKSFALRSKKRSQVRQPDCCDRAVGQAGLQDRAAIDTDRKSCVTTSALVVAVDAEVRGSRGLAGNQAKTGVGV